MSDKEIQAKLGNPTPFSVSKFAAIIKGLIGKQSKGQEGTLLNNGDANIFYVKLANGTSVAVRVRWFAADRGEWHFDAYSLGIDLWDDGYYVFSRS